MRRAAPSFDEVSEFMRGLNNVVSTPRGVGRVVERKRDGTFAVELVKGGAVISVTAAGARFFFANLELKSTAAGPPVAFEMTLATP